MNWRCRATRQHPAEPATLTNELTGFAARGR
jgi:hypothetical protein